ncbi:MAG: hypothetical protein KBS97_02710 [Firmicutes bacterium]|nr:hypothetical protein [Candidatus Fiminaster equi]
MAQELLEPERLYTLELKDKHHENTEKFFEKLTKTSGVDTEANKLTCKKYYEESAMLAGLNKKARKLAALKGFFIFLCLLIIGIFLLIFVYKPRKKELDAQLAKQEALVKSLLAEAYAQMSPLNSLFESSIPCKIMQTTTPLIQMDRIFDVKKYELMREKYGLWDNSDEDSSTLDLQSGSILGNPFVIFKDLKKDIVDYKYEGTRTISYTVGSGQNRRTVTQTLHAYVTKPKPIYSKETYLVYASEAGDRLSFNRTPSSINTMDEKAIEKYVRKHEGDLQKMAEKATKKGGSYTPLGNSEFELFFGGLDRNNEIQYRLLFTPLGQKSMMEVLKSKVGFGDDFSFTKVNGINIIQSTHSQGTALFVDPNDFKGFDYEVMHKFFVEYNDAYFKALFFDFAPLLAIPLYQQLKSHEYIYKNNVGSNFNCFEHEVVANRFNPKRFAHPDTRTDVLLKTWCQSKVGNQDVVGVKALSYETFDRVEIVPVMGGDGHFHDVPVHWVEYCPLENNGSFVVGDLESDDEIGFRGLGQEGVIYARGLVSGDEGINVDINKIKSIMKKD